MNGRRASRPAVAVFLCALLWMSVAPQARAVDRAAPPLSGGAATTTRAWAHDAAAASAPSTTWYLAEGCTAEGFETWVLVQNPGSKPVTVRLTYMTGQGRSDGPEFTLAPFSRKTVNVADTLPDAAEVSTVVDSSGPVVVERAMYGSGYPSGTKGEDIIVEARILAVADVVEAMSSHRPYRPALGIEKALAEIVQGRGVRYDADVVDACVALFKEGRFELT